MFLRSQNYFMLQKYLFWRLYDFIHMMKLTYGANYIIDLCLGSDTCLIKMSWSLNERYSGPGTISIRKKVNINTDIENYFWRLLFDIFLVKITPYLFYLKHQKGTLSYIFRLFTIPVNNRIWSTPDHNVFEKYKDRFSKSSCIIVELLQNLVLKNVI